MSLLILEKVNLNIRLPISILNREIKREKDKEIVSLEFKVNISKYTFLTAIKKIEDEIKDTDTDKETRAKERRKWFRENILKDLNR